MNIKAAIFDCDGTILNSMWFWPMVGDIYLKKRGITPPADLYAHLKPLTIIEMATYLKEHFDLPETVKELVEQVNAVVREKYEKEFPLKEGAIEVFENLKSRGIRMYLATATDRYLIEPAFKRLGLDKYFEGMITCTEAGEGKSSPKIYLEAMKRLLASPNETIIVEDALHAVETCVNAGFFTVAVADVSTVKDSEEIKKIASVYYETLKDWSL
ncbi:MAG: HAD family phosphatase [Lachnospira sp.]|nr:HAD family phosphatase [Lachnospira sp.]